MKMTTNETALIETYLAQHSVTRCPPAHAQGNEMKGLSRSSVTQLRAQWKAGAR